jgi:hypothetical protein
VARPGAVVGVSDAGWDGELLFPTSPLIKRSREIMRNLRRETSPYVGKRLRTLLTDAGFVRCQASARMDYGTPESVREFAESTAVAFESPRYGRAVDAGWTTPEELAAIVKTWRARGEEPGAFVVRVWCEAVGWVDDRCHRQVSDVRQSASTNAAQAASERAISSLTSGGGPSVCHAVAASSGSVPAR